MAHDKKLDKSPVVKDFGSYSMDFRGETSYIGILPKIIVVYGQVPNQNFKKPEILKDPSYGTVARAGFHYQERVIDLRLLDLKLKNLVDDYVISLDVSQTVYAMAKSCDCYAEAFMKRLGMCGLENLPLEEATKPRPELTESAEFLYTFLHFPDGAEKLF
jgi:hypothetical protein